MSGGNRNPFIPWIARSLWAGCLITCIVLVAGCVWALLAAADDITGAAGAKGVFLVAAVLWCLNVLMLIVLTAMNQLIDPESPRERSQTDHND